MDRPDIASREDLDRLLRRFYDVAMRDAHIGYLFTDVARLDLEAHLPVITDFWESVLLNRPVYRGTPMRVHHALHAAAGLEASHFQRWFTLWAESVEALFAGPVADEARRRAATIAEAMQHHLRIDSPPEGFGEAYRRALGLAGAP